MAEVIMLPEEYWVFDFTKGEDPDFKCPFPYQIGRYDEIRPGMYTQELFGGERDLHVGIDIGVYVGLNVGMDVGVGVGIIVVSLDFGVDIGFHVGIDVGFDVGVLAWVLV